VTPLEFIVAIGGVSVLTLIGQHLASVRHGRRMYRAGWVDGTEERPYGHSHPGRLPYPERHSSAPTADLGDWYPQTPLAAPEPPPPPLARMERLPDPPTLTGTLVAPPGETDTSWTTRHVREMHRRLRAANDDLATVLLDRPQIERGNE
jgi:hypothetical protein